MMKKKIMILTCLVGMVGFLSFLYFLLCSTSMFSLILSIVVGVIPVIAYLYMVILIDKFEPEPWIVIICLFLWGAGITTVSSLFLNENIGSLISKVFDVSPKFSVPVVVAPIVEEVMKFVGIVFILMVMRDRLTDFTDVIVYGSILGLGFAMVENIFYYTQLPVLASEFVNLFIIRGILSAFVHPFFCVLSLCGLLFSYKVNKKAWKILIILLGLILAICFHCVWNSAYVFYLSGGVAVVYFGVYLPAIIIIGIITYFVLKKQRSLIKQPEKSEL